MQGDKDTTQTRERLLEAACEMFAQKGYIGSSVSEITKLAQANKAAINYHFGNKEKLYQKAWRNEFNKAIKKYPIDGGVDDTRTPEEKLKGHIFAFTHRIADPENREFDIVKHEHVNPTGLLREVMKKSIDPVREHLRGIVCEILEVEVPSEELQLCCISIASQCIDLCLRKREFSTTCHRPAILAEIDQISEHIYSFSLAGLKQIRFQYKK